MLAHPAMGLYSNASAVGKLLRQPEGRTKFDLKREVRSAGQGRMAFRAGFLPPRLVKCKHPKAKGKTVGSSEQTAGIRDFLLQKLSGQ